MPRRRNNNPEQGKSRSITITVDEETAIALDQYMFQFGLESKQATVMVLVRSSMSAMPLQGAEMALLREALRQIRNLEYSELANYFLNRANLVLPSERP